MTYVPGMITVAFIIIRIIIKVANSGKNNNSEKEYTITSNIPVEEGLVQKLGLNSGQSVLLAVQPGTNIVDVKADGGTGTFEKIGAIQDTELAIKVEGARARAYIRSIMSSNVELELIYN